MNARTALEIADKLDYCTRSVMGIRIVPTLTIKPCPFCGSETAPTLFSFGQSSIVSCSYALDGCDAKGPYKAVSKEAVAAWNKRADQSK